MNIRGLVLCAVALLPITAMCADAPPPVDGWTGKGQLGYVASQGNTNAKSANASIDMALVDGLWKHAFHLGGLYGQSEGVTSAERWDSAWQSNYNFSADAYAFGGLRYAHDMFSGFQYQATASAGVGYQFIDTTSTKLSGQVGVGYRKSRPELIFKNINGVVISRMPLDSTGEAVVTAGLDYAQVLSSTTSLSNKLLVESGSSNTLITDALALTVKMSDRLALSLGLSVQDNTKPPPGLKKVDTVETVNLVFAF